LEIGIDETAVAVEEDVWFEMIKFHYQNVTGATAQQA